MTAPGASVMTPVAARITSLPRQRRAGVVEREIASAHGDGGAAASQAAFTADEQAFRVPTAEQRGVEYQLARLQGRVRSGQNNFQRAADIHEATTTGHGTTCGEIARAACLSPR
jgi:hypothetical protein